MTVHTPLCAAPVGGKPVRFFRSPNAGPDLPWHAVEDLGRALGLDRSARRLLLSSLRRDHGGDSRTIATGDDVTVIAPHFAAQGLIAALMDLGKTTRAVESEYTVAVTEAMQQVTAHLSGVEAIAYTVEAFRRSNGLPPLGAA